MINNNVIKNNDGYILTENNDIKDKSKYDLFSNKEVLSDGKIGYHIPKSSQDPAFLAAIETTAKKIAATITGKINKKPYKIQMADIKGDKTPVELEYAQLKEVLKDHKILIKDKTERVFLFIKNTTIFHSIFPQNKVSLQKQLNPLTQFCNRVESLLVSIPDPIACKIGMAKLLCNFIDMLSDIHQCTETTEDPSVYVRSYVQFVACSLVVLARFLHAYSSYHEKGGKAALIETGKAMMEVTSTVLPMMAIWLPGQSNNQSFWEISYLFDVLVTFIDFYVKKPTINLSSEISSYSLFGLEQSSKEIKFKYNEQDEITIYKLNKVVEKYNNEVEDINLFQMKEAIEIARENILENIDNNYRVKSHANEIIDDLLRFYKENREHSNAELSTYEAYLIYLDDRSRATSKLKRKNLFYRNKKLTKKESDKLCDDIKLKRKEFDKLYADVKNLLTPEYIIYRKSQTSFKEVVFLFEKISKLIYQHQGWKNDIIQDFEDSNIESRNLEYDSINEPLLQHKKIYSLPKDENEYILSNSFIKDKSKYGLFSNKEVLSDGKRGYHMTKHHSYDSFVKAIEQTANKITQKINKKQYKIQIANTKEGPNTSVELKQLKEVLKDHKILIKDKTKRVFLFIKNAKIFHSIFPEHKVSLQKELNPLTEFCNRVESLLVSIPNPIACKIGMAKLLCNFIDMLSDIHQCTETTEDPSVYVRSYVQFVACSLVVLARFWHAYTAYHEKGGKAALIETGKAMAEITSTVFPMMAIWLPGQSNNQSFWQISYLLDVLVAFMDFYVKKTTIDLSNTMSSYYLFGLEQNTSSEEIEPKYDELCKIVEKYNNEVEDINLFQMKKAIEIARDNIWENIYHNKRVESKAKEIINTLLFFYKKKGAGLSTYKAYFICGFLAGKTVKREFNTVHEDVKLKQKEFDKLCAAIKNHLTPEHIIYHESNISFKEVVFLFEEIRKLIYQHQGWKNDILEYFADVISNTKSPHFADKSLKHQSLQLKKA